MQTLMIRRNLLSYTEIQNMSYFDFKYYTNDILQKLKAKQIMEQTNG